MSISTDAAFQSAKRDCSLVGRHGQRAVEVGLSAAQWYHTAIPRKHMKELMRREDGPPIRDTTLWLGYLITSGVLGSLFWGTLWCLPFFVVYGVLYGSASDSRWHECGDGTAFKTQWTNDAVYRIACFMIMRNPVTWRWSHTRHHTGIIIVGRDPEIAIMRPPDLFRVILNFFGMIDVWHAMIDMVSNAAGVISKEEKTSIPEMEQSRAIRIARAWLAVYLATIALALAFGSWLPLMLVGLPRLYGAWHNVMTGLLQHGGLADSISSPEQPHCLYEADQPLHLLEHELPCRASHVPDGASSCAAELHETIKHDLPARTASILAGYREMLPAFTRQLRNEDYFLKGDLPSTARPYRKEFHQEPSLATVQ